MRHSIIIYYGSETLREWHPVKSVILCTIMYDIAEILWDTVLLFIMVVKHCINDIL